MSAAFKFIRAARVGLVLCSLMWLGQVAATTINVNYATDNSGPGYCSLRDAIKAANTNSAVQACPAGQVEPTIDVINVPAGVYYLAGGDNYWDEDDNVSGDLDVLGSVSIVGAGARSTVIVAPPRDRVLHLRTSAVALNISVQGMTLVGGNVADNPVVGGRNGGTALTSVTGSVTLKNLVLRGGRAQGGGNLASYTSTNAKLLVDNVTVTDGEATGSGGGIYTSGTATLRSNAPQMRNLTISGNRAPVGGGLTQSGLLDLNQVTITANHGGGIYTQSSVADGLWIANSIVAGNSGGSQPWDLYCQSSAYNAALIYWSMVNTRSFYCTLGESGAMPAADPLLTALFDFGAGIPVHALRPGSPGMGAGRPNYGDPDTNCLTSDARGVARAPLSCDIGAYSARYDDSIDSTADLPDAAPGDGSCAAINGACTLRAAAMEASASGGRWILSVPNGTYTLTRPLDTNNDASGGDIDIAPVAGKPALNFALIGQGDADDVQIVGGGTDRVIEVRGKFNFHDDDPSQSRPLAFALVNATVRGGRLSEDPFQIPEWNGSANGGGLLFNNGRYLLDNVVVRDNVVSRDGSGSGGLMVQLRPDVVVRPWGANTSISDYLPFSHGISMERFAVVDNHVLGSNGGTGGLLLSYYQPNSQFPAAIASIRNGTIAGNSAEYTGGLVLSGQYIGATYLTVTGNEATNPLSSGGAFLQAGLMANSLITGNFTPSGLKDCEVTPSFLGLGYILLGTSAGCAIDGDLTGNQLDVDPLLGPMELTAGGMPVYRLHQDSPALDAIPWQDCADPASGQPVLSDARGAVRPEPDGYVACTMGAVEGNAIPSPEVFSDGFE
ncbi:MAG TPA: choice-of-anchor Q domain-containing protein [Xanthomonadaceae bacterium]|nr:choice-of-anchor Q domain-containing protein [Xanthomonadaceae bacterium]